MSRSLLRILGACAVLLFAAGLLRSLRHVPAPEPLPTAVSLPLRPEPPVVPPPPAARWSPPPRTEQAPARLRDFLEKLGRARLLRDRRTLGQLQMPAVFESDAAWLVERLGDELFVAAGAAELAARFRIQAAVPALSARLLGTVPPYLQDIFLETLGSIGGDAAAVALATAARSHGDEGIRARAAAALGAFQGPEAYHALIAALGDPSALVCSAASAALSRLPSPQAVEALLFAMGREARPAVQGDLAAAAYAAAGDEDARALVLNALRAHPAALEVLQQRRRALGVERYGADLPADFFRNGAPPIPASGPRRIGITVEAGPSLAEVGERIFGTAPFDRFRAWFRFRKAEEFPSPKAYDTYGRPAGEAAYDELDGSVFLRFRDPKSFEEGVLGYTTGCEAYVTGVSLMHEFGHAFARLGDEYAEGSRFPAPNVATALPAPWEPLIARSLLDRPLPRDAKAWVPSEDCHLSNRRSATRYCPVCQLEIYARMSQLVDAPLPW